MADGIKIRELNQTTVVDNSDVLVIDKLDSFGDTSLTYYISYGDFKSSMFSEDITFEGDVTVDSLTVNGPSVFNGTSEFNQRVSVNGTIETENINVSGNANINLGQLRDVEVAGAQADYYLMYNGTSWVPSQVNVTDTGGQSGQYILFEGGSTPVTFEVTVGPKTSSNQFFGIGSDQCFYINGIESPVLMLPPNRTFIFDQSDSSNTSRRLRFYEEQSESILGTSNSPGLSHQGIPGFANGRTILTFTSVMNPVTGNISEQTAGRLFYRCEGANTGTVANSEYMGATVVNVGFALEVDIGDINSGGDGGGGFPGFPFSMSLKEALEDLDKRIGTVEGTMLELE